MSLPKSIQVNKSEFLTTTSCFSILRLMPPTKNYMQEMDSKPPVKTSSNLSNKETRRRLPTIFSGHSSSESSLKTTSAASKTSEPYIQRTSTSSSKIPTGLSALQNWPRPSYPNKIAISNLAWWKAAPQFLHLLDLVITLQILAEM